MVPDAVLKNRVQQLIEYYRKKIKEEEISDILEG